MRRTRIAFVLAAILYTLALAVPRDEVAKEVTVPLPMEGITEVELRGSENASTNVFLCRETRPYARHTRSARNKLSFERRGGKLIVDFVVDGYGDNLKLCLSPAVRVLSGPIDQVNVGRSADAMELRISQPVAWHGDARELRVVDVSKANPGCDPGNQGVTIGDDSRIANLVVSTWNGSVVLDNPASIGEVHLRFGPKAKLTLGNASSSHDLHFEPYDRPAPARCPAPGGDSPTCSGP